MRGTKLSKGDAGQRGENVGKANQLGTDARSQDNRSPDSAGALCCYANFLPGNRVTPEE